MKRFLIAWELGTGMGHLAKLLPVGNALLQHGHTVVAALKHFPRNKYFQGTDGQIPILLSPPDCSPCRKAYPVTSTYCQLLHNVGFGDANYLRMKVRGWQDLIKVVQPDLMIADHAPMALLAAKTIGCPAVTLGTGFTNPSLKPDFPLLDKRFAPTPEVQNDQEKLLLEHCNRLLDEARAEPLLRLSDLYRVKQQFLITHEELDHFGPRENGTYWGTWNFTKGAQVEFPEGKGPKIFGYLKQSAGLESLLQELRKIGCPALIVGTSFTHEFAKKHSCETLHVRTQPVDVSTAARWCDFAILNATQATVAAVLRAGKPIFNIPLQLEQLLMARRVIQFGAGGAADGKDPQAAVMGLNMMIQRFPELTPRAQRFAERYSTYDSTASLAQVVNQIEALAADS